MYRIILCSAMFRICILWLWYLTFVLFVCCFVFALCLFLYWFYFLLTCFMSDCCKTEIETYEMIYIYVCMYVCMYSYYFCLVTYKFQHTRNITTKITVCYNEMPYTGENQGCGNCHSYNYNYDNFHILGFHLYMDIWKIKWMNEWMNAVHMYQYFRGRHCLLLYGRKVRPNLIPMSYTTFLYILLLFPQDEDSRFLMDIDTYVPCCTVSDTRRPYS